MQIWHSAGEGEICLGLIENSSKDFDLAKFMEYNPSVGNNCQNLTVGQAYCVDTVGMSIIRCSVDPYLRLRSYRLCLAQQVRLKPSCPGCCAGSKSVHRDAEYRYEAKEVYRREQRI